MLPKHRNFRRLPFRLVLTFPLLLPLSALGLVGYLTFRSGRKGMNVLADQLMNEVSHHVQDNLREYVSVPHTINANKAMACDLGYSQVNDLATWEKLLIKQVPLYPYINFTSIGTPLICHSE